MRTSAVRLDQICVTVGGVAAIVWVLWFFLAPPSSPRESARPNPDD